MSSLNPNPLPPDLPPAPQAAHEHDARERRHRAQSRAILQLIHDPAAVAGDFEQAIRRLTEIATEALAVAYAGVWLIDDDGHSLRCIDCYDFPRCAHGGNQRTGRIFHPAYFAALDAERCLAIVDTRTDPRTSGMFAACFEPQGIVSTLDTPLRTRGHVIGIVCLEHPGTPRVWTADEQLFASALADQAAQLLLQDRHARAEETAREATRHTREIFDHAMEAIFSVQVTPEGEFFLETHNPAAARFCGVSEAAARGRKLQDIFPPEVSTRLVASYRRCIERNGSIEFDEDLRFMENPLVFHTVLTPVRDESGRIFRIVGFARDVTGEREAERKLAESERLLRTIQDSSFHLIGVLDVDGHLLRANQTALAVLNLKLEDVQGKFVWDTPWFSHSPTEQAGIREAVVRAASGEAAHMLARLPVPGRGEMLIDITIKAVRDETGRVIALIPEGRDITEQKRVEEALRISEEKFSKAFRSSPDAISMTDLATGEFLDVNEGFERLFECKREQVIGRSSFELGVWANPADREQLVETLRRSGTVRDFQATARTFTGKLHSCSLSGEVVEIGGRRCLVLVIHDITDRLAAEQALRASEEKFSKAFRSSPDAISISEFEAGRYIDINEGHTKLFGFTREEAIGKSPIDLGIHTDAAEIEFTRNLLLTHGSFRDIEIQTRNRKGDPVTILMSAELIHVGGTTCMLRVSRDITDRKKAERALRESEARFRSYFESPLIGMAITGTGRQWIEVNDHLCQMLGYTREELLKLRWSDLTLANDVVLNEHLLQRALKGEIDTYSMEKRYRRKDGSVLHANISVRAIRKPGGAVDYFLTVVQDITQRVEAENARAELENQLRQAQKLEAIGQLAGGIAHDFNNILTAIMAYAELAEMDAESPVELRKHLAQVQSASQRARDLVRRILAFSRQRKDERKPLQLQPVINEALKLLRSTLPATIEIVARIDEHTPVVLAESVQIHQVMMNLCTNAAHAMRDRQGRLSVSLETADVDEAAARLIPDLFPGRYAQLTVGDNGHGMSEDVSKRIFEPFFTTKGPGEGTGLGLAVVHGIVKDHQGVIAVETKPGAGTTFRLFFPEYTVASVENIEVARTDMPRGHGERILFVDDERTLCDSAQQLLERLGYRITAIDDPEEALRRFRATPLDFDLVVTDLTMPRMTGVDLAREVVAIRPGIAVLLLSGFSGSWTSERVRALGIFDLISKPLNASALAHSVRRGLDEKA